MAGIHLSLDQLKLALPEIKVSLNFDQLTPLKISRYAPTIMSPFTYFTIEYVGSIISLHHNVTDFIEQNGHRQQIQNNNYTKKDRSQPISLYFNY